MTLSIPDGWIRPSGKIVCLRRSKCGTPSEKSGYRSRRILGCAPGAGIDRFLPADFGCDRDGRAARNLRRRSMARPRGRGRCGAGARPAQPAAGRRARIHSAIPGRPGPGSWNHRPRPNRSRRSRKSLEHPAARAAEPLRLAPPRLDITAPPRVYERRSLEMSPFGGTATFGCRVAAARSRSRPRPNPASSAPSPFPAAGSWLSESRR